MLSKAYTKFEYAHEQCNAFCVPGRILVKIVQLNELIGCIWITSLNQFKQEIHITQDKFEWVLQHMKYNSIYEVWTILYKENIRLGKIFKFIPNI